jgi:2-oxoglutarate ferredoxin oxidoreductase subunit alpha
VHGNVTFLNHVNMVTMAPPVKAFVLPDLNYGQMFLELERVVAGKAETYLVPRGGGTVHRPEVIYEQIKEAAR